MSSEAEHKALNRAMGIAEAGNGAGATDGMANSCTREPLKPAPLYHVSQAVPALGLVLTAGVAPASAGKLVVGVNFGVDPVKMATVAQVNAVGNQLTQTPAPLQAFSLC